jgi:tetratricopeptide (TPR) repeat protein
MKPEERHELKTNELADWIADFPQWVKENVWTIVGIVLIAAALLYSGIIKSALVYLNLYHPAYAISRAQIEMSQLTGQLEMAKLRMVASKSQTPQNLVLIRSTADRLDAIVGQLNTPEHAAFALIKEGEALRAELHYAATDFAKDPNALEFQINKAKNCYQLAMEKAGSDSLLAAMAQFGLGLCQEELGNFEEAQKIYHEIAMNEKYAGTAVMPMARDRIADMADYKGKFVFVETPKPAIEPSLPLGPRIEAVPKQQVPAAAPQPAPAKPAETNSAPNK